MKSLALGLSSGGGAEVGSKRLRDYRSCWLSEEDNACIGTVTMPEDLSVREISGGGTEGKSEGLRVYESCWLSKKDNQCILKAVTIPEDLSVRETYDG